MKTQKHQDAGKRSKPFINGCVVSFFSLMLCGVLPVHAAPLTELKVMSFNIWLQGGTSLSDCIQAIRTNNADIVGLAECNATTAQTIASQLGYYYMQGGGAGECCIVSRYPLVYQIGQTANAYGGIGAMIEVSPGQRVAFFAAHLNYTPYGPYWLHDGSNTTAIVNMENSSRMPGLNELLNLAAPYIASSNPTFLVGDFNAPSHFDYANFAWPTSVACTNAGLGDSYHELHLGNRQYPTNFGISEPGITWTPRGLSSEPSGIYDRIDYIHYALGKGVTPTASTELDASNSNVNPWPSDHRAVITTFTLTPPTLTADAANPAPANGATNVPLNTLLTWTPSSNMISQAIYFGASNPGTFQTNTTNSVFVPGPLTTNTTYHWRVDTTTSGGVVTGQDWSFTTYAPPPPTNRTNEWTFALGDLQAALGNAKLTYRDNVTSNLTVFGTTDGTTVPHIGGVAAKYIRVPQMPGQTNGFYVSLVDSAANGGGAYINQYTIVQDVLIPSPLNWVALFNTDTNNNSGNDADFYISNAGAIGSTPGYSANSLVAVNTWYRIATVTDLNARTLSYYINGSLVRRSTSANGVSTLDGRWAIYANTNSDPSLLLFNEGDTSGNYTHQLYLHTWAFVDRALSDGEIAALGGPKAAGIFPGSPIQICSTNQDGNLSLSWMGGKGPFLIQRTPTLNPPSWEDIGASSYLRNFSEALDADANFYRVKGN